MIDISKIKPGDKVTLVPLEVVNACSQPSAVLNPIQVEVRDRHNQHRIFWVGPDQIAAHHPAPREIEVGDRVRDRSHLIGEVLAIAQGYAMVKWPGSAVTATQYRYLTLVEGDHECA
jgi:hypothetical protein